MACLWWCVVAAHCLSCDWDITAKFYSTSCGLGSVFLLVVLVLCLYDISKHWAISLSEFIVICSVCSVLNISLCDTFAIENNIL